MDGIKYDLNTNVSRKRKLKSIETVDIATGEVINNVDYFAEIKNIEHYFTMYVADNYLAFLSLSKPANKLYHIIVNGKTDYKMSFSLTTHYRDRLINISKLFKTAFYKALRELIKKEFIMDVGGGIYWINPFITVKGNIPQIIKKRYLYNKKRYETLGIEFKIISEFEDVDNEDI